MFRIYYKNGKVFTGEKVHGRSDWLDEHLRGNRVARVLGFRLPYRPVVAILQYDESGKEQILSEYEYYLWMGNKWVGINDTLEINDHVYGPLDLNKRIKKQKKYRQTGLVLPGDAKYNKKVIDKLLKDHKSGNVLKTRV